MFDCHVRRRDENRFRVRESVKPGLTVVWPNARNPTPQKGMTFTNFACVIVIHLVCVKTMPFERACSGILGIAIYYGKPGLTLSRTRNRFLSRRLIVQSTFVPPYTEEKAKALSQCLILGH